MIQANETIEKTSLGSIVNDYNNRCPMFAFLLRNENDNYSDSVNKNAEISAVLSEYTDVFPDELPKGLLPKRTNEDFRIEFKEGTECPTLS